MRIRTYDKEKDAEAVKQMWVESGWSEYKDHDRLYVESQRAIVADIEGQALALAVSSQGDMRYLDGSIPLSGIGAVITDLTARKLRLGSRLTAHRIALDAQDGAWICGLGAFEDGYYNRLGFGTGCYDHNVHFAPSDLKIDLEPRRPRRLTAADWELMHRNRLNRRRVHGSCSYRDAVYTQFESAEEGFGFGYCDEAGELTHHFWLHGRGKEEGPFRVVWMAYHTYGQLLELLALLKSFGDQFHQVSMSEPPHLSLQDLLHRPFYQRRLTRNAALASKVEADAWWQVRICDLERCVEQARLFGGALRFNLQLSDPIREYLDAQSPWLGVGGEYVVTLGAESSAARGSDGDLPTLAASVGAFTRWWLGAHSARRLSLSDDFAAPEELLVALDRALRLPEPWPEWEF